MLTGWQEVSGQTYYFGQDGKKKKTIELKGYLFQHPDKLANALGNIEKNSNSMGGYYYGPDYYGIDDGYIFFSVNKGYNCINTLSNQGRINVTLYGVYLGESYNQANAKLTNDGWKLNYIFDLNARLKSVNYEKEYGSISLAVTKSGNKIDEFIYYYN
ncbi:hypothetical protein MCG98_02050 [Ruminococcus sp. OA3]|uniref:hypothetical protein n=1 Tax=Ruminococcus sp. OA3 TaxID=2914164 RepID=UPI001F05C6CC|nr:hypothetical protein [Ruminococcus sp. OA3]MCH1981359.1 hypothetical protein [Ruminococcus sp. OA3]